MAELQEIKTKDQMVMTMTLFQMVNAAGDTCIYLIC